MKIQNYKQKIKTREEIIKISEELKKQNKTVVSLSGSFDLLHAGHLDILNESAEQGDVFIVGLNSDISIRSCKGNNRPLIPQEHRAKILANLSCIDYITIYYETDCFEFIKSTKPDVHVNGADYGENCIEAELVKKLGGRLHIVNFKNPISTTDIINKIKII